MSEQSPQSWQVRWKGEIQQFPDWQDIQEALDRDDLSLMHEVEFRGRWWSLRDFLEKTPWMASDESKPFPQSAPPSTPPAYSGPSSVSRGGGSSVALDRGSGEGESASVKPLLSDLEETMDPKRLIASAVGLFALVLLVFVGGNLVGLILCALVGVGCAFYLVVRGGKPWNFFGVGLLVLIALTVLGLLVKIVA